MIKLVAVLSVLLVCAAQDDYYDTEDDNYQSSHFSLEELRSAVRCINDRGPCNTVTASFRKHYPSIIQEACKKCKPEHKLAICTLYKRVAKELPEELVALKKLHDPDGKYWNSFYNSVNVC